MTPTTAGGAVQGSMIGVGPALQKARLLRRLTVDEASRDTRIRSEFLEALEHEDFDVLLGDVYVRGALRSYSIYLGLDPGRVVEAYASSNLRQVDTSAPPPAALEPALPARRRDNHRLAILVAATLLALAAAFGVLSASRSAPPPARLPASPPPVAPVDRKITVSVDAVQPVSVTVTTDGVRQTIALHPGEGRSFEASSSLSIVLDPGGSANVTVDGEDLGAPGKIGEVWRGTFSYEESGAAPSPNG